ncbi:hypothetical protein FB451DRAFT_1228202 [Mycena latifolia]|nr:hypothetical protein FB451DRAFT_1228202 [Mycena latifolia]
MSPQSTEQNFRVRLAVNPTGTEVGKATTALCEAFRWQFFTDALDGDASLVPEILGAYLKAGLVGGQVYWAENKAGEIVGVSIWFPPGTTALGTPEQRAAGWDPLMAKLSEKCRSWWIYFLELLYDKFVEDALGPGVMLGAYHLQLIGIHPDYQRQGIATTMMGMVEQQARANNTICMLETPVEQRAKVVYKALGYEIRGHSETFNDPDGKPDFRFYVLTKDQRSE